MSAAQTLKRGGVAIVGAAESDLGEVAPGMTPVDLMAQATCRALADCGLTLADVDGVFASGVQTRMASVALTEYLRLKPRYQDSSFNGGSVFETMVGHAAAAIQLGLCSVAVIAYGSTQRSVSGGLVGIRGYDPLITPFGPRMPIGAYALAASRHMHEFGTTREHLAEVAVAARQWALLNPVAWEKKPLTVQDVLSSRMVSHPFTLRDCCLVTDGGGAVVLVSAERARSLPKPPAYVLGIGDAVGQLEIHSMDDLTTTCAVQSGQRAFEMARLTPKDVDVVELYDAFTINTILFLEDLGFVPKGEGGRFVSEGRIAPGGELPVNTNGGGLSYGHPGMYGLQLLIEAVRQVRGECGVRQVRDCHVAVAHGNGGTLSSQSTVILGSAHAL
ncbi:acetyl-CoA acetyltransferase [Hydrogenophaga sp. BPS33]|uniref:acetyl-CoA acetyltransferase n=1 Tax=Hydrogenophaga sp. BPS33 TaxID=2651974 RepID=UPI00131FA049|nr:acetyl-CoA acetyltransferase [Hydrogenophaga sp. BPS33]QHE84190.1 thiolase [Hydrogenophaga sp. BPS33]